MIAGGKTASNKYLRSLNSKLKWAKATILGLVNKKIFACEHEEAELALQMRSASM